MQSFGYVDPPDIPEGMTITEWRTQRAEMRRGERLPRARTVRRWIRAMALR